MHMCIYIIHAQNTAVFWNIHTILHVYIRGENNVEQILFCALSPLLLCMYVHGHTSTKQVINTERERSEGLITFH